MKGILKKLPIKNDSELHIDIKELTS